MAEEAKEEKKSGGKGLIIVLLVVVILLLIGMGVMAMMLLGGDKDKAEEKPPVEHAFNEVPKMEYSPTFKQYPQPAPGTPPSYFEMKFVVNFQGEGKARFLAVDLKFMSRYPGVVEDMEHIRPVLLNDINLLLRQQTHTELSMADGPETLRQKILEAARKAANDNGIFPDLIQNVFLTRLVMQ
jgi:flagellar FliL protein